MRRLPFITAFALFLAVPLWAQRGGGHGGFGGHSSFGGSHGGGFAGRGMAGARTGGRFSGGMHAGFSRGSVRGSGRRFSGSPYRHDHFRGGFHNRSRARFHSYGFRNYCYGYACGYARYPWSAGYYDPWSWNWDYDDARFDADYYNNLALANEMNEQSLEQQRMLRQEEADHDQDLYARPAAPRAPSGASSNDPKGTPIVPPTILVFRDHHQQEIQNYAIVGQTLWNFASPHTQKIPLADLDLAATEKMNDDRGVAFQVPGGSEGQ